MENNHYLCIVIEKEINNMNKKITKLGSVNPCVLLFLYDKDNKGRLFVTALCVKNGQIAENLLYRGGICTHAIVAAKNLPFSINFSVVI